MYIKVCSECSKGYECCITYEPEICSCGGPLEEDMNATHQEWDRQELEMKKSPFRAASFVRKITTVGQQAEANAKRMGRMEVEERLEANKTQKTPGGDNAKHPMNLPKGSERRKMTPTKIDKALVGATASEIKRYIETGVKPVKNEPTMKERKKLRDEKVREKQNKRTKIISTGP